MAESRLHVSIRHRSELSVGGAVSDPLSDVHRIGCANGRTCLAHDQQGQPARAHFYCRVERAATRTEAASVRAFHLCASCVVPFARRYGVEIEPPDNGVTR